MKACRSFAVALLLLILLDHQAYAAKPYVVERIEIAGNNITQIGLLYRSPEIDKPRPGMIVLHGWLPEGTVGAGMIAGLAFEFQQAGYITLALSMRGWPETGGVDDCGDQQADDIAYAADWFARQPYVDNEHLVLLGHSQGAQVALLANARNAPISAVVALAPPTELIRWRDTTNIEGIIGYVDEVCALDNGIRMRSPLFQAEQMQKPVLLLHGAADKRVPTEQSRLLYAALKKLNKKVTMHIVPNADHGLAAILDTRLILDFLEQSVGQIN